MKLLFAGSLAFVKVSFLPDIDLLTMLFLAMVVDFATGCWKAKVQNKARTSEGFKKTVGKFMQYAGAIVGGYALSYIGGQKGGQHAITVFEWFNNGLVIFIIYIEITSIFENLYAIDPDSRLSQLFFQPAIKLLTFQLKNNPVIKSTEQKP
ncbi:phage holin family protein [Terrimonas sp. NA20]|uniref:Phage holin family protein n=1 Tax=Terrimonas ginsenosidimutans TaxID=2908004 RepID=A0ABS9KRH1_9BACT|nr:phage holin family protein [Terrimonas ginsenosidimutans]MCG2614916.1 phage holin family protein [Terrimonas ginsenosidimutans]